MKLLTETLRGRLPPLYSQGRPDPLVQARFFTPWDSWTWYAIEFDGEDLFWGFVDGFVREFGYFSLSELESVTGPLGLRIERDVSFEPTPLSVVKRRYKAPDG